MNPNRKDRYSFTLIELLVVVGIISILAAMLLPALKNARATARRTACLAHLKQVSLATFMLADDNNGWINGTGEPNTDPPAAQYWLYTITNYMGKSDRVLYYGCPDKRPMFDGYVSYGAYSAFVGYGGHPMHTLYEVKRPSRVYLVAECYSWYPNTPSNFDSTCQGAASPPIYPRHQAGGLNFVFVDGHGEFCKSTGYNSGTYGKWYDYTPGELSTWPPWTYDMWGDP
ncbi:MAG: type II secretion system protein [Verrucomicrobia bacterium]|nr:type II secretion system protein [Verrucomicrobiota bacterium]